MTDEASNNGDPQGYCGNCGEPKTKTDPRWSFDLRDRIWRHNCVPGHKRISVGVNNGQVVVQIGGMFTHFSPADAVKLAEAMNQAAYQLAKEPNEPAAGQ